MDELEQVRQFDRTYKQVEDYQFLMCRVVKYIFLPLGVGLMLFPLESDTRIFLLYVVAMQSIARNFHLKPYMKVTEDGKLVSIYEKLKYLPITNDSIFKVRKVYLTSFCIKLMIANIILQQIGAAIEGKWTVINLIHPLGVSILVYLLGLYDIKPKRTDK
ncbi:MAG: hypothetical protein Q4F05_10325 [bacterium]|nr:hypothetical protein [bacterium]